MKSTVPLWRASIVILGLAFGPECLVATPLKSNLSKENYPLNGIIYEQQVITGQVRVTAQNSQNQILAEATVKLSKLTGEVVATKRTNAQGFVEFLTVAPGEYLLEIMADRYQTLNETIMVTSNAETQVLLQLADQVNITDTVTVQATAETVQQTALAQGVFTQEVLKMVPLQSQDFDAALPLVPNVIRPPDGKVSIKGAREDQSALLVNNADATDPATGNFALSIPLESIERVNVFTNPYLPEYGKFTGGLVKVETKRGGDKFKFELDDFFPEPRFRGGKLFGFTNVSPRLHLEGPIIKNRLYFSQGIDAGIDKKPVRGLPSPINEIRRKDLISFTQFDYLASPQHTVTLTANYALIRTNNINLDFFNPQVVAPNFKTKDLQLTLIDRRTLENGSFIEANLQVKRLTAEVFGKGDLAMRVTPLRREGNFFRREERTTDRYQISLTDTLPAITALGRNNVKFGIDASYLRNNGSNRNNDVLITDVAGQTLQQIQYQNAGSLAADNTQLTAFAQNQWLISRNLNVDYGLRFEAQRNTKRPNVMPRVSLTYSPDSKGNSVIRASAGLFYDKVPLNVTSFLQQPRQTITTIDPQTQLPIMSRAFDLSIAQRDSRQRNTGRDFRAPRNATFSVEYDQRFSPRVLVKVAYLDSRTRDDFFISPVNDAIVLFNTGRRRYRSLETTTTVDVGKGNNFSFSYIRSRAKGELNDFFSFFGDFPDPIIRPNEFGRVSTDAPNRILARGTLKLPFQFTIVPLLEVRTGFPYSVRDLQQDFVGNRNRLRFPRFISLDTAFIKELRVRDKYTAQFTLSLFNLSDHFNPRNIKANLADPGFGTFFASYRRFYRLDLAVIW
jgi:Carboxypeptidase regulatory-like domain/TonB-dependent Receptor Plug Domain